MPGGDAMTTDLQFTDSDVTDGTSYEYTVRAKGVSATLGHSSPSFTYLKGDGFCGM